MKNALKKNSRFEVLNDDISSKIGIKNKPYKCDNIQDNSFKNKHISYEHSRETHNKNENELSKTTLNLKKEKQLEIELQIEKFPQLISLDKNVSNNKPTLPTTNIQENPTKFSEKLKTNYKKHCRLIDVDYDTLEPGWVLLKKDKSTRNIITKYKDGYIKQRPAKTDYQVGCDILDTLAKLNHTRRKEYIDSWGYDEWEKTFMFPNYDYEYFDKLDELYRENSIDNSENNEDSESYEDTYDF